MNRNIIVGTIVGLLVGFALGYLAFHSSPKLGAVSSSGNTFSGTNSVTVTFAPLTSTSTSILNNGGNDRAITKVAAYCTSVGTSHTYLTGNSTAGGDLVSWQLSVATTSVASLGLQGNANYMFTPTVISTTTGYASISTTTEGVLYAVSRLWPVNTYLTFNTNATNTATCSYTADFFGL